MSPPNRCVHERNDACRARTEWARPMRAIGQALVLMPITVITTAGIASAAARHCFRVAGRWEHPLEFPAALPDHDAPQAILPSTSSRRRSMRPARPRSWVTATTSCRARVPASRMAKPALCSSSPGFRLARRPASAADRLRAPGPPPLAGARRPRAGRGASRGGRRGRATSSSAPARSRMARRDSRPSLRIGISTFSRTVNSSKQEMELEDEAEAVSRSCRSLGLSHGLRVAAADAQRAAGRPVEQAEQVEQRRLAGPRGPVSATNSLLATVRLTS